MFVNDVIMKDAIHPALAGQWWSGGYKLIRYPAVSTDWKVSAFYILCISIGLVVGIGKSLGLIFRPIIC